MRKEANFSGRQSDPSGGVSAFRAGGSLDGTNDYGIPGDKFVVGDSASELVPSSGGPRGSSAAAANNDLQGMYDRILGANGKDGAPLQTISVMENVEDAGGEGTLLHNPTIN